MAYSNNKTDIGAALGHLCVIGSGESAIGAFGEAGGNVSRTNIGWHVEDEGAHHVFLSLEYGYDEWKQLAEVTKKEVVAQSNKPKM